MTSGERKKRCSRDSVRLLLPSVSFYFLLVIMRQVVLYTCENIPFFFFFNSGLFLYSLLRILYGTLPLPFEVQVGFFGLSTWERSDDRRIKEEESGKRYVAPYPQSSLLFFCKTLIFIFFFAQCFLHFYIRVWLSLSLFEN